MDQDFNFDELKSLVTKYNIRYNSSAPVDKI